MSVVVRGRTFSPTDGHGLRASDFSEIGCQQFICKPTPRLCVSLLFTDSPGVVAATVGLMWEHQITLQSVPHVKWSKLRLMCHSLVRFLRNHEQVGEASQSITLMLIGPKYVVCLILFSSK